MAGPWKTYEEANWDKLSPASRDAHNRLRQARGLRPLRPPKVDNYKPPPLTGLRVPTADDEKEAMEELGVPHVDDEEGQLWVGINELRGTIERLRAEEKRLALKNAQTKLQDRALRTEVLHTTIIKVAITFLTTTPGAEHTLPNAVAAVMRFFGAKRGVRSGRRVWVGGEVSDRTVENVLKEAEAEAQAVIGWLIFLLMLQSLTLLDMRAQVVRMANPVVRTPEQERERLLENIRIAEDSDNTAAANLLYRRLWRADRLPK